MEEGWYLHGGGRSPGSLPTLDSGLSSFLHPGAGALILLGLEMRSKEKFGGSQPMASQFIRTLWFLEHLVPKVMACCGQKFCLTVGWPELPSSEESRPSELWPLHPSHPLVSMLFKIEPHCVALAVLDLPT